LLELLVSLTGAVSGIRRPSPLDPLFSCFCSLTKTVKDLGTSLRSLGSFSLFSLLVFCSEVPLFLSSRAKRASRCPAFSTFPFFSILFLTPLGRKHFAGLLSRSDPCPFHCMTVQLKFFSSRSWPRTGLRRPRSLP